MPSDGNQTIQAVANGGSPQPVAVQDPTPTSNDQFEDIADDLVGVESSDVANVAAEGAAAIDAAVKAGDISKSEAKELKKTLKLKVDGKEYDEVVDFNDEESLKKHLQKSKAFDSRLKEFSTYRNQVQALVEQLKNDPESVLERMGLNVDDLAEKRLKRKVEEMQKTPEQLELEKMRKELEDHKKRETELKAKEEAAEMERMRNQHAQEIENDITGALESAKSKLPKNNPFVMQKIAQNMLLAMKNGYPNVSAKDVIPLVEKQWKEELRSYFDAGSEEFIEELVGKQNLDRYRKTKVSQARQAGKQANAQTAKQAIVDTGKSAPRKEVEKPKKSFKSLFSIHDD